MLSGFTVCDGYLWNMSMTVLFLGVFFALRHICSFSMNFMVCFSASFESNAAVPELYS